MEKEVKNILEDSMKQVVLDAVKDVDIKGIMTEQIKNTTEKIARDMFGSYGDFQKELEAKLKEEITFNINKLSVPNFGQIAVDTVSSTLAKLEIEEKDKIVKDTERRLQNFLGTHKEPVTLTQIENLFGEYCYKEYIEDSCSCDNGDDRFNSAYLSDVLEYIEYNEEENEFQFTLLEREWTGSSLSNHCVTHLNMLFIGKSYSGSSNPAKEQYSISIHINRDKNDDESYANDDFWKKDKRNCYKILGIDINGRNVSDGGTVLINSLENELEEVLVGAMMNGMFIDATKLSNFEIEQE